MSLPEEVKAAKSLEKIVKQLNQEKQVEMRVDTTSESKRSANSSPPRQLDKQPVIMLNKEVQTQVVEEDPALLASTRDKMESELKATMEASLQRYQEMKDDQSKKVIEELKSTYEMLINEIKYNSGKLCEIDCY